MKRSPLRRTPFRRRIKKAAGRPSLERAEYRALIAELVRVTGGLCEVCGSVAHDPHHIKFRSRGGADSLENLILLCRTCHDRIDAPYAKGKLVLEPVECGVLIWIVTKEAKWSQEWRRQLIKHLVWFTSILSSCRPTSTAPSSSAGMSC